MSCCTKGLKVKYKLEYTNFTVNRHLCWSNEVALRFYSAQRIAGIVGYATSHKTNFTLLSFSRVPVRRLQWFHSKTEGIKTQIIVLIEL